MLFETSHKLLALGGISGISAHILIYRHGEWDLHAPAIFVSYASILLSAVILEHAAAWTGAPYSIPLVNTVLWHIAGIYISMLIYRGFFHRLSEFPGPFFARLSNFYVTALSAKKLQLYNEVQKLHRQYGDYIRIGPTEISIVDPMAVTVLHGVGTKVHKGPWYTVLEPRISLQMDRNKKSHSQNRKIWDQGFSSQALRCYEPRVKKYTSQLMDAIDKRIGTPINMATWFNYLSFDVMGDMAFGKSFDMLSTGQEAYLLKQVHTDMKTIGLFSHLTWLFPFFKRTPGINADYLKQWNWIDSQVQERSKNRPELPDVFSWILDAYEKTEKTKQNYLNLQGEAYLIVVAGSDTTGFALSNVLFYLVRDQSRYKALQEELKDFQSELSYDKLATFSLLNAVINETLRLHPAVPSGVQRTTPPEGIMIGEKCIPGNTMVSIPMHSLFRDARLFPRPDEFIPERWTTQPELVKDPSIFVPFSTGAYSCVGKQLALMELRRVTAEIVTRYNVTFAPNQTEDLYLNGEQDTFTAVAAPLEVIMTKR
ncbi:cytochrome P450 [Aspergillus affinis]|uniref:cytochrome P450 n=1 Tax=Aspergillus affinis TaxID=1070780 RepID=UPI0022FEA261|nr:cytochrome P450 monooxygenase [Aspergillus affinis]KAI9036273.1 cytochrome P450 monooxygenase [Aspergillus affinis]